MRTIWRSILGLGLLLCGMEAALAQQAPVAPVKLSIEAQPLADALNAWAYQTGYMILVPIQSGQGVMAPRITGEHTPEEALKLLLASSGLQYQFVNERTVAIRPARAEDATAKKISISREEQRRRRLVLAQAQAENQTEGTTESDSSTDSKTALALDEVVVTATRREESAQRVPLSVLAFGAKQLDERGIKSLANIERSSPGLNFGDSGDIGQSSITVRGLNDGARNIGVDPRVGVYIDGVYIGRTYVTDQPLLGVERVEVLRGPQGTLFGKNTVAGAINITTERPTLEPTGTLELEGGSRHYQSARGRVSGHLSESIGANLSVQRTKEDNFLQNVGTGGPGTEIGTDLWSARADVEFSPSDRLNIIARADYMENTADRSYQTTPSGVSMNMNDPNRVDMKNGGGSIQIDYELPFNLGLTSITAYRDGEFNANADEDLASLAIVRSNFNESFSQVSQELRVTSAKDPSRRGDVVAGVYYIRQDISTTRSVTGEGGIFPVAVTSAPGDVRSEGYAAYANGNWRFTPQLELNLGARYSVDQKEIDYSLFDDLGFFVNIPGFSDSRRDDDFSPRAGINFYANDDVMLYASYSKAFKSGGWNADFVGSAEGLRYEPETATSTEVGLKSRFLDRRVQVNLTGFHTTHDDLQVLQYVTTSAGTLVSALTNAGKATTKGAEFDITARIGRGGTVGASGMFNDAAFDEFPDGGGPGVDFDGNRLPYASRTQIVLFGELTHEIGDWGALSWFASYSHSGDFFASPSNGPRYHVEAGNIVDANVTWAFPKGFRVRVSGRNLTNKDLARMRSIAFLGNDVAVYNQPRDVRIEVSYRF